MIDIKSRENKLIKEVYKLNQHKYRLRGKKYLVEGLRILTESLLAEKKIQELFYTQEFKDKPENKKLVENLERISSKVITVTDSIMSHIADTKTPSGILAVLPIDDKGDFSINSNEYFIILDKVHDPGNLGTIMRNAHSFGVKRVVLLKGCADPYSPKAVRASAGAVFYLDLFLIKNTEVFFQKLKKENIKIIGTKAGSKESLASYRFKPPFGIVFGSEAHGLSKDVEEFIDDYISIPISREAESLNVSVSSGIILYVIYSYFNI